MTTATSSTLVATLDQLKTTFTEDVVAPGYKVTREGVFEIYDDYDHQLTSVPVWVSTIQRTFDSQDWSMALRWRDHDGKVKSAIFAYEHLMGRNSRLEALMRNGLFVLPGELGKLQRYIAVSASLPSIPRVRTRRSLGLFTLERGGKEQLAFMLPSRCLVPQPAPGEGDEPTPAHAENNEVISFHPTIESKTYAAYSSAGSLDDWKHLIESVKGNPLVTFAVCTALAGPFLEPAGVDNAIFHVFGKSSIGKTTTLQAAVSVWGCAADPERCGRAEVTLVERWNSTANALEPIAATHSNMFLAMDELGSNGDGNLSVYNLTSGKGKSRMTDTGGLRDDHRWRLSILSSGELSMQQKIEESLKRKAKEGEMNRANDIPVAALSGIPDLPLDEERALMHGLKDEFAKVYGTAGPAFVQVVLDFFQTPEALHKWLREAIASCEAWLAERAEQRGTPLGKVQRRALRRFAFVLAIGLLAVEAGTLPHTEQEVEDAIDAVIAAWLSVQPSLTEGESALQAIREYAIGNVRNILPLEDWLAQDCPNALLPYVMKGIQKKDLLLLTPEQFKAACGGHDERAALIYLRDEGLLKREADKLMYRVDIKPLDIKRGWFYAIRTDRLHAGAQDATNATSPADENETAEVQ